jgi:hypothetical protein
MPTAPKDEKRPRRRHRRTAAWIIAMCTGAAMASMFSASGRVDAEESTRPEKMAADDTVFSSRKDAEDFLARTLPLATAANPKYYAKADKVETRWLTKSIEFHDGAAAHGIQISTDEEFTEVRAGVATPGTHQAVFSLGEVNISMEASGTDVTEAGEPALGIIFNCAAPKCIQAKWSGQASRSDSTDIYLQDPALRARILAAFEFLKSSGPKSPS